MAPRYYQDPGRRREIDQQRQRHYEKQRLAAESLDATQTGSDGKLIRSGQTDVASSSTIQGVDPENPVRTSKGAIVEQSVDPTQGNDDGNIDPTLQINQQLDPSKDVDPPGTGGEGKTETTEPPQQSAEPEKVGAAAPEQQGGDPQVAIPEDWEGLSWNDSRALAKNFTDKAVTNREHANKIIAGEIKRRKKAEAGQ